MKSASPLMLGMSFHLDRIAEIAGDRFVERNAVVQQLLEAPDGEVVGIDGVILSDAVQLLVLRPLSFRKLG